VSTVAVAMPSLDSDVLMTASGAKIDFRNPSVEAINMEDIAIGLSRAARWAGQTRHFFSVAQHSMLVAALLPDSAPPVIRVAALLHDAAEAYMCDIPTPLKRLIPEYKVIEDRLMRVIHRAFMLPPELPLKHPLIESADRRAASLEATYLHSHAGEMAVGGPSIAAGALLSPMSSSTAQAYFSTRLRTAIQRHASAAC
jgi:uncharacterized protein